MKMERKLKKFLILFDNESLLYFPGSFLSGQILVECEGENQIIKSCSELKKKC